MAEPTGWVVLDHQPSPVDPKEIPTEAATLAIEIVQAAKRYDPPNRVDFFDSLIGDLELARQQVHDFVHGDDGKLTG